MSELTIKYINGLHESYDAKNIKEAQNGFSFDTFDDSNERNHFFIPYSAILFTNNRLGVNNDLNR